MISLMRTCMEILYFVLTLTRPYSDKVLDFVYRLFMGRTPKLPPVEDKILLMPATELADRIRKRRLTCEEVMKAYIKRIKQVQPILNACEDERFEEALEEARKLDEILASGTKSEEQLADETPLLGVPFSCKESIGVKGLAQTKGLVIAKDRKAPEDGGTAALYREAGAIPVVVTTVPELLMWWESSNHVFGMTINPYDKVRTVGGSSGGEGAILTAAGAIIGIGSDIAGSIRIPGSFCGIYGHKPSRDLISVYSPWPNEIKEFARYKVMGPMCRYVQDLPLLVKILSGDKVDRLRLDEKVDFHNVKIYYIEEFPGMLLSPTPDIKAAVRKAAKHFEDQFGLTATKLYLEELRYAFEIWECKLLELGAPAFKDILAGDGGTVNPWWELFKNIFRCSEHTLPAIYFAAVDRRTKDKFYYKCLKMYQELEQKLGEILQGDAVLLVPTHPEPPPQYLMTIPKYPNIAYTCIFNILGYPSSQIPAGLSNGLPIGIQAISTLYNDHLTLAAAVELDKVFGGWISPCPISVS